MRRWFQKVMEISVSRDEIVEDIQAPAPISQLDANRERPNVESAAVARVKLNATQATCLRWWAEGESVRAIASIEKMPSDAVRVHLDDAQKALDARSLAQATVLAMKLKLI